MNLEEIKKEADLFFDFPTDNKDHVTTTSAMLFVRHCLKTIDVTDMVKRTATRCAEIADLSHAYPFDVGDEIRKEFYLSD